MIGWAAVFAVVAGYDVFAAKTHRSTMSEVARRNAALVGLGIGFLIYHLWGKR